MISQDTMEYLLKRQIQLISDQHEFEEMLKPENHGSVMFSREEVRRLITETQARRNELALLITCNTITEEHRAMDERETAARHETALHDYAGNPSDMRDES